MDWDSSRGIALYAGIAIWLPLCALLSFASKVREVTREDEKTSEKNVVV